MPSQRKVKPLYSNGSAETAERTAAEPVLILQPNGSALLSGGKPGNKGGGRTPDEFKAWMATMASSAEVQAGLDAILADPLSSMFLGALKHVTEHGYGKPKEQRDTTVSGTVTVVYSRE